MAVLSLVMATGNARSQDQTSHFDKTSVWLYAGESLYDFSGTGSAFLVSSDVVTPLFTFVDLNLSLMYMKVEQEVTIWYGDDSIVDENHAPFPYLYLDVQPQFNHELIDEKLQGYIGLGATVGLDLADNRYRQTFNGASRFFLFPFISAGVRLSLGDHMTVGGLARFRMGVLGIGEESHGDSQEWAIGVGWRF